MLRTIILLTSIFYLGNTFSVEVGADFIKFLNQVNKVKKVEDAKVVLDSIKKKLKDKKNIENFSLLESRFLNEVREGTRQSVLSEFRRVMTLFLTKNALTEFRQIPSASAKRTQSLLYVLSFFIVSFFITLLWSLRLRMKATRLELQLNRKHRSSRRALSEVKDIARKQKRDHTEKEVLKETTVGISAIELFEEVLIEKLNFREIKNLNIQDITNPQDANILISQQAAKPLVSNYLDLVGALNSCIQTDNIIVNFNRNDNKFTYKALLENARITGEDLNKKIELRNRSINLHDYLKELEYFFKRESASLIIKNLKNKSTGLSTISVEMVLIENRIEKTEAVTEQIENKLSS